MDWRWSLADEKIREAIAKGEFDDVSGKGKPLPPDELEGVPDELRVGFKLLRNAGAIPPELELRKEMLAIGDLLACCRDEDERGRLRQRLSLVQFRYRSLMEQRGWSGEGAFEDYRGAIEDRLLGADDESSSSASEKGSKPR
ncbi:DnaJ family domain-containing protein [Cohnella zeiphila]|uniref:DUF1992 domain-containing protein n=1 Tax=Cohnella zeiphila TaxID=2761120 RepID=A0A7X0VVP8_9BACL|nr:DnaJ family domain-containing protein [Cohnella zeiphila]MBB6731650.1 DUF1992 domain-containing protein [Cohnella zeiphila]